MGSRDEGSGVTWTQHGPGEWVRTSDGKQAMAWGAPLRIRDDGAGKVSRETSGDLRVKDAA